MAKDIWNEQNGFQNWDTAGNWSNGAPPGASDTAVIADGSDPCVISADTNPVTVSALVVDAQFLVDHDSQSDMHTYLTVRRNVTVGSNGNFIIDNDANSSVAEGSTVVIKGTLTNDNQVSIGSGGASTYVTDVTVGAIDNSGSLGVISGPAGEGSTALHVKSAAGFGAAGSVVGNITVQGANSQINFKSGSLTKIAAGSNLKLDGANALVTSGGHTTTNSALTKLSQIDGTFTLGDGAKVSITGDVDESGTLSVDHGSRVSIAGTLTNDNSSTNGNINVAQDGGFGASGGGKTILSVGSIVDDVPTRLTVSGGSAAADESIIYDKSAAGFGQAGVVDGDVSVSGYGLIQFGGGGQITQIAARSSLSLYGANAFVADAGKATSNSALTGLATVAGTLTLQDGASVSTGQLANSGIINLVAQGDGASSLTVDGSLTNSNLINVDGDTGTGNLGKLRVSGATGGTSDGTISLGSDSRASLLGTVYHDQTLHFHGSNAIAALGDAAKSSFNVTGFASGDMLDLKDERVTRLSYADSTLTLTLSSGQKERIAFTGSFDGLTRESDGNGGTYILTTASSESPMADASGPDICAQHANLAQSAALADAGAAGGPLHASFAEMMAHAIDGGSGAMTGPLHEAAGAEASHATALFAAALHGH